MKKKQPTVAELKILRLLWEASPLTVKEIHEKLYPDNEIGYTTILKTVQVMTAKGFLSREKKSRQHLYTPIIQKQKTNEQLLERFVDNVFAGSSTQLMMQLLGSYEASPEEIEKIKKILDKKKGGLK